MLELYSKITKKALFCLNHCSGAVLPGLMPNAMIFYLGLEAEYFCPLPSTDYLIHKTWGYDANKI
jgi:hypothetical protein